MNDSDDDDDSDAEIASRLFNLPELLEEESEPSDSADTHQTAPVTHKGPWSSLSRVRHSLNENKYAEVLTLTSDLLRLDKTRVREPGQFILGKLLHVFSL
jgi:hypothetical protein